MSSSLSQRGRLAALAFHAVAVVALVPAFVWWAPATRWNPLLIATLAVLAVLADLHDVPLRGALRFDAGMALALIAVIAAGPLAALAIDVLAILTGAIVRRERLLRPGTLANVAAYGWKSIAAAAVLALAPGEAIDALPWLLLAAATQAAVNLAVGPAVYATLWLGRPVGAVGRMLWATLPAAAVMLAAGVLTAVLLPTAGLLALAGFAAIAVIPQTMLTAAARPRPVSRLDRVTATRRYAHALALQLGLDRAARRHLARVIALAAERAPQAGDAMAHVRATLRDASPASLDAGHIDEWWNGRGGPAGLQGRLIPRPARIAAVALAWSALTARGGPQMTHADALRELDACGGERLDPRVVFAAHRVIEQERVTELEPAPEPRLHRLGVPLALRRALAAAA